MKTVRVEHGAVVEIIPDYALPVETWYGPTFATQCHEAPEEVAQGWVYDEIAGTFAPPAEPEPTPAHVTEITALKAELTATDYKAIKYAEGWLTEEEYAPIKAQRQSIRDEINRLEVLNE